MTTHTFKPIIRQHVAQKQMDNSRSNKLSIPQDVLIKAQDNNCFYCDKPLLYGNLSRDHLFPQYHGFGLLGNRVFTHHKCNSRKSGRYPTILELLKMFKIYSKATKNKQNCTLLASRHGKPRFKLVMTKEIIDTHLI